LLRGPEKFGPRWGSRDRAGGLRENRDALNCAVVVHEDPDGGFWGELPVLPGCCSQDETADELGVLEVLKEQGREPDSNIQIPDAAV